MKLIIASNNAHKVREIQDIVGPYFSELCTMKDAGLSINVIEDGETFEQNACKKAEEILKAAEGFDAALADDSGLMVDALDGGPGVYSARYAGEEHDDALNNAKLLDALKNVPDECRTARFVSCVALARRGSETITAVGSVEGIILREKHGDNGFGYDPLFLYPPFGKSFAELTQEEKNSVSHRKSSLEKLRTILEAEQNS